MSDLTPPSADVPSFVRPAEYYELPQTKRILPRWVPFGCGMASIVFLLLLFAGGAALSGGRAGAFLESMFGKMQTDIDGEFTKDVTAQQRAAFDGEMKALRVRIRTSQVKMEKLQPLLRAMLEASEDNKITPAEADRLIAAARQARQR